MYAPLYGETNVTNILMAVAVAVHLGMSLAEIAPRVGSLEPAEHRMVRRVLPDGTTVIDDAYSANPVGTAAALEVLRLHEHSAPPHRHLVGHVRAGRGARRRKPQARRAPGVPPPPT